MNDLTLTVKIEACDLVSAIARLASAIGGNASSLIPESPQAPVAAAATAVAPPAVPPVSAAASVPPVAAPAVPVAGAPTYTLDQISKAGAALVDAGKMEILLGLLARYGVQAVTQLAPEQYGSFATELRALGAQI
ncbi:MAG: hypothetical protein HFF26_10590 [Oscillospiraceae bacterium]|nr:hypothetical protein [Oscillospiraceae bacterium]